MLVGSVETRFSYGLMVVAAPESTDSHEYWDAATETVHARPDSLYVGVRQAASGLVKVRCFDGDSPESELTPLFSGMLTLPSARLRIYDPDETISMIMPVTGEHMAIAIYADDNDEPSELEIYLAIQCPAFS